MTTTEDEIARLAAEYERLNALVKEAHGVHKDIKQEIRELKIMRETLADMNTVAKGLIDRDLTQAIMSRIIPARDAFIKATDDWLEDMQKDTQAKMKKWLDEGMNQPIDIDVPRAKRVTIKDIYQLARALRSEKMTVDELLARKFRET